MIGKVGIIIIVVVVVIIIIVKLFHNFQMYLDLAP